MPIEKQYKAIVLQPFPFVLINGSHFVVRSQVERYLNHYYPNQWEEWNGGILFGLKYQPGTPLGLVSIEEYEPDTVIASDYTPRAHSLEDRVARLEDAFETLRSKISDALIDVLSIRITDL